MGRIGHSKICPILGAKIMSQSKDKIPVIVQLKNKNTKLKYDSMEISMEKKSNLPLINGIACSLSSEAIYELSTNNDIEYISFDSKIFTQLDVAVPTIEADIPYNHGVQGEGVTVAIIDTGINPHEDLIKPYNRIIGFKDLVNNEPSPYDDNGHGTHVAGIIAGNGYASRGKYRGVAPKANILSIKALDRQGGGSISSIISAISYIVESKDKYKTKIINLSIGSPANNYCENDPLCRAVKEANKNGLIIIASAGNNGPSEKTILSPGISPYAITVGAIDDKRTVKIEDDTIANFSSRGPTIEGLVKPDLVAPGVNIISLSNKDLDGYSSLSGTSMAAPFVSGTAALLLSKDNSLSHSDVKEKLIQTCRKLNLPENTQGAGIISFKNLFASKPEKEPSSSYMDKNLEKLLVVIFILLLLDNNK